VSARPHPLRRLLFRLHWLLGLGAGLVLAVVGVTGALLSFEAELLDALNPQYRLDAQGRPRLPIDQLVRTAQARHPGLALLSVAGDTDPSAPIELRLGQIGQRGGTQVRLDPYTGMVLPEPRGGDFFHVTEELHRFLAAGPVGKQLVGASTVALIVLAISGIVLRWPRRWRSPRAWLRLDLKLRGRALLWHLHAVLGTWLMGVYLVSASTGLWWSYEFYRGAVNALAGLPAQPPRVEAPVTASAPPPAPSLDAAFAGFLAAAPEARRFVLQVPVAGDAPLDWRYLTAASAHSRAFDSLRTDRAGRVLQRQAYAELPRGRRFVASIFPLHSGDWWGTPGRVVMALAALLMPMFAVIGCMLWLQRRARAPRTLPVAAPAR